MSAIPEPSRRRLAITTAVAFAVAALIFVVVVLPAEFGIDPTGFGRLSGLSRLAATPVPAAPVAAATTTAGPTSPAHAYPAPYRSDTFDIPLEFADELEFKVAMKAGGTFVYSWKAEGAAGPEALYVDFHSEVPHSQPEKVEEYRQANEVAANGSLVAPFDGVHGWFLQNQGDDKIIVHLTISGFYDLIPPGEVGNSRGIVPRS